MTRKIHLLSSDTINKIAAGEVIENSASVLKELIENAIDANATKIHVEITAGGKQLIRIQDNGCGMTKEDLALSIQRHATSKITAVDDLEKISTMGFRGEALAATAAVSRLTITSRTPQSDLGTTLEVDGGKILNTFEGPSEIGTTIAVRSLFYNVPARRKFQKSIQADVAQCTKMVENLSCTYPEVHFTLLSDGNRVLHTTAHTSSSFTEQLLTRAQDVFSENWNKNMVRLEKEDGEVSLKGWISLPEHFRHNRSGLLFFINRRFVQCSLLQQALIQGYGTLLGTRQFPSCILHLNLPQEWVDVNVHPQKSEVRLLNERLLFAKIIRWVQSILAPHNNSWSAPLPWQPTQALLSPTSTPIYQPAPTISAESAPSFPFFQEELSAPVTPLHHTPILASWPPYVLIDSRAILPEHKPNLSEGLFLIHQPRAWHRLLLDAPLRAKAILGEQEELLIPLEITLTRPRIQELLQYASTFELFGISVRQAGPTNLKIDALHSSFDPSELIDLLTHSHDEAPLLFHHIAKMRRPCSTFQTQQLIDALVTLPSWSSPFEKEPLLYILRHDAIEHLGCIPTAPEELDFRQKRKPRP